MVCDNSKTYMSGDVSVAVRNHVKVHFLRRVKASLPVRDRKGASDALHGADVALHDADALAVRLAAERLASCGVRLERASGELAFAGDHVSSEALRWHLEMCEEGRVEAGQRGVGIGRPDAPAPPAPPAPPRQGAAGRVYKYSSPRRQRTQFQEFILYA